MNYFHLFSLPSHSKGFRGKIFVGLFQCLGIRWGILPFLSVPSRKVGSPRGDYLLCVHRNYYVMRA